MKTAFNLYGPINRLGYGVHFTNWAGTFAAELAKSRGLQAAVIPFHQQIDLHHDALKDPVVHAAVMRSQDFSLFDPRAPSICLWQLPWVTEFAGNPRIFYTTFEGTLLNPTQLKALEKIDALWVTTHWHEERLLDMRRKGMVPHSLPIYVVPEGVNPKTFHLGDTSLLGEWGQPGDEEATRFVSVGKMEARKGMSVMVRALYAAAKAMPERQFILLAHWYNPFLRDKDGRPVPFPQGVTLFLTSLGFKPTSELSDAKTVRFGHPDAPNLQIEVILRRLERQEELVGVYRYGNFGLFPSFAEGWNLPLHESMACGLPPITTDYSGHSEYLQEGTYINCGPGVEVIAKDNQFFPRGDVGTWREIRDENLQGAITLATSMSRDERTEMGRKASKAALVYTWDHASSRSIEVLTEMGLLDAHG